jgi:hypothetical protein
VTWIYVAGGLTVNVTDMIIFAFEASPGFMRSQMLVLDGIALVFPMVVAVFLLRWQRNRPGVCAPGDAEGESDGG